MGELLAAAAGAVGAAVDAAELGVPELQGFGFDGFAVELAAGSGALFAGLQPLSSHPMAITPIKIFGLIVPTLQNCRQPLTAGRGGLPFNHIVES